MNNMGNDVQGTKKLTVNINPGHTALTRILGAASTARPLTRWFSAAFVTEYAYIFSVVIRIMDARISPRRSSCSGVYLNNGPKTGRI